MEAKAEASINKYAANISSITEAQERIRSYAHKTPISSSQTLNSISGRNLYFKCECLQKCGSFKFRGAINAVFSLTNDQATKGVVTHSRLSGGQVIWSEATMQSREEVAAKVLQDTGGVLIHPYNDGRIISGQGTVSLELLEQIPHIDTIIVPISGGGLISGVALAAKSINPAIRVLAAEPKGADDAARSKQAGNIVTLPETKTVADGLRASLGTLTWPVVRDLVDDIIVVEDEEIIEAMRLCYQILKVVVEPSGAIGLAAVLSNTFRNNPTWKDCNNVGIILSGGNVGLDMLWESLNKQA